ncbi:glycosyltransferase [Marivirga sp. S37H4]|uniref:Glycosyltransferase n=1 Tax=Marivirga aurantiaca TaxID=2802615 RepID=A0A935CDK3_9BACT|nr:glycosyltransferase [Marivirga aurantiaca]MBK6267013.1 glycosyltransferase [Marivirga aurantiaca]
MNNIIKLALIAHDFPPYNVGGSQRPYLMAKALAEEGIEVFVFTLKEEYYNKTRLNFEYNFNQYSNIHIIRTDIDKKSIFNNSSHYFSLVDDIASRWKKHLIIKIKENSKSVPFDLLLFTCPPFSLAKHAVSVSKETEIPFALDLRDAWSQWIMTPYASYLHYKILIITEKKVIEKAAFVSSTSQQQIKDFKEVHKTNFNNKFIYAPNGFIDFVDQSKEDDSLKVKIIYTGSFYFNPYSQALQTKKWYQKKWYQILQYLPRLEDWSYRSPLYFFKTLELLISKYPKLASNIEVVFAGQKPDWFERMVADHNLQKHVNHLGFINKKEVQLLLKDANYLLITSSKIPNGKEYSVAGKTFEYIAYQKPILAFVNEGEQKEVLKKTQIAHIFNPDEIVENVVRLKSIMENEINLDINHETCNQFKIPNNFSQLIAKLKNL